MSREIVEKLEGEVAEASQLLRDVTAQFSKVVVGQEEFRTGLLTALLSNGHVLIEGVPGLAKTLAASTLSDCMDARFSRIQFTPDLLPADITGTMIYQPQKGTFIERMGPIFAQMVLADEINRAPAKVQSALLEAMQERQVTFGGITHPLPEPFFVMATQNPIEQEGTYPLPEAQVDRFMLKLIIDYPTPDQEMEILTRMGGGGKPKAARVMTTEQLSNLKDLSNRILVEEDVLSYIVRMVDATRHPRLYGLRDLEDLIQVGSSPRGSLALLAASRSRALLYGQAFVTPDLVKEVAPDALRHRIIRSFEAEAEEVSVGEILSTILDKVPVTRR
ncbi:MAG TPA: AAA family ATPase [Candidatus Sabulitectum sp.]|nr:AAA family ATPase [Candidatus Sabulitectum sp.]HPF32928.1 AAA family ATPase [Candidatus Sabulitectum sp.]HPJ28195.1 AAA family ATPase [Candidatus Sabulitectum sp.]HPR21914.1 AAA family ATPase [Candidatus Sabulitectum sp.]